MNLLASQPDSDVQLRVLICLQSLTQSGDEDLLVEMRDLNLVKLLLELLSEEQNQNNAVLMSTLLTNLTYLSLNDQNNIQIRLLGAHIIGKILMKNCPTIHPNTNYYS